MIAAFRAQHSTASIAALCRLGEISRSWLYEKRCEKRTQPVESVEPTALPDTIAEAVALRDAIERIVLAFPGYGYRRVAAQLARDGWSGERAVNHKRVLRVMREESLLCRLKKRFVTTTDSAHRHKTYPNLLKGLALTRPDQAWVADLTYIRLPTGFCYLATVLDAFSRRCVGWHLSRESVTGDRHAPDARRAGGSTGIPPARRRSHPPLRPRRPVRKP